MLRSSRGLSFLLVLSPGNESTTLLTLGQTRNSSIKSGLSLPLIVRSMQCIKHRIQLLSKNIQFQSIEDKENLQILTYEGLEPEDGDLLIN